MGEAVPEQFFAPLDAAIDRRGIGINQQLGGVAAKAFSGRPRAVHPEPIVLARADPRQQAVPHMSCTFRELEPLFVARLVEEAHLYRVGNVRRDREIGPLRNRSCAEREIVTSQYIHPVTVPLPRRWPKRTALRSG